MNIPETRYARSGDMHIAFQVVGDGPFDLLFVHGWVSHIEHLWEEPSVARFFTELARFSRLILLDKRGTGLSDPVPLNQLPTLEERMDDLRAVLDAAACDRATLVGTSEAGALNLLFAATEPHRTTGLILLNSYARLAWAEDYPFGIPREHAETLLASIEREWGKGVAFEALIASQSDNQAMREWWRRYQRLAASPGAAVTLLRSAFETDARGVLGAIRVPTLILHRVGDPFTGPEHGRYLAEHIEGARYVELSGGDHLFFSEDTDRLIAEIREFLTGVRESAEPERVLATILFLDVVDSTAHAAELGDRRWRDLLDRYYGAVRRELTRFRGVEIDTAGDGVLATFDGPARAIRCASAVVEAVGRLGVALRAGLHTGECEMRGDKVSGIAVHTAARIAGQAAANEVLVSSTVRDLVAGSAIRFRDAGPRSLRGVPGDWRLFAVAT
ncbi:MAG TPA: adenylate/guanylate cyclase domain-containing protein [Methylomirabilota bacterium]|jgi:pimeloyl-ACP methyl ester carboxylesterase|nr:adenylate/guanylate cyclase domain-containing protein [Methylomirabilota bacterium]